MRLHPKIANSWRTYCKDILGGLYDEIERIEVQGWSVYARVKDGRVFLLDDFGNLERARLHAEALGFPVEQLQRPSFAAT